MPTTLRQDTASSLAVFPARSTVTVDLLLTFRGESGHGPAQGARLPLVLSIVLDRSGSMAGKPLQRAKAATEVLLDALSPKDTVSIVAFDSHVSTLLNPTLLTDASVAKKALSKVRSGGSTALHAGWVEGCKLANIRGGERVVRRVLLLTDGQATKGITDPQEFVHQARAWGERGISTTTLGFGNAFNEDLLIGMADASGGNFYYIETPEEAVQVFAIEGEALTSITARDLTVTLTPEGLHVRSLEVWNGLRTRRLESGALEVTLGDVYRAEDKLLAVRLVVDTGSSPTGNLPLLRTHCTFSPADDANDRRECCEGTVIATVGDGAVLADSGVLRTLARLRVAHVREQVVALSDAGKHVEAAGMCRVLASELRERGLDDLFEMAEELAQIEHFATVLNKRPLRNKERKILRDQAYQGRSRNRSDLLARGSSGGSAKGLPVAHTVGSGVELLCLREGGKLVTKVVTPGYDEDLPVLLPRSVREEGVRYVVDKLVLVPNGTFYRTEGAIRRLEGMVHGAVLAAVGPDAPPDDPLKLTELFTGGGEPWLPVLKPVIEKLADAATFIGPGRDKAIVPLRELTFQALKPNPPQRWRVVVFGQNPYPRVESATGIAMFDNAFGRWSDPQFGKVISIRCIIKAAAMWKYGVSKATPIAAMRKLLDEKQTVQPPEWFQAMLTQGVLLLNAALTASSDGALSTDRHTLFWRPVVDAIVEEILRAKQNAPTEDRGVVFAWWGASARNLRPLVERLEKKYPAVKVRHVDHCNPAAQGDIFCDGDHFGAVNAALASVGAPTIDWLPSVGWNTHLAGASPSGESGDRALHATRMGDFIQKTMDLHKMYLERLQGVLEEAREVLAAITEVEATPTLPFVDAVRPLARWVSGLEHHLDCARTYAETQRAQGVTALSTDEIAAVHLYTTESPFYRKLNAALRQADRSQVTPWFPYLKLLLGAIARLEPYEGNLWRGVATDLRKQYPKGDTVTWWGVSSCTAKRSVAMGFLGFKGKRTLFEVGVKRAVSIRRYSAFTGEDEYLLAPGTQLIVSDVKADKDGLVTITLTESLAPPLVT
jgi:uracil DNA glycosylase